jgi:hypothetical protein
MKIFIGSCIVLIIAVLVGCLPKATINSLVISRDVGSREWHIDNPILAQDLEILDVKEVQEGDLLYVNVLLQNTLYRPKSAKVKVEFYDRDGVQLENPWGWRPIILESHQEEWYRFMAPKSAKEISAIKIMVRGVGEVRAP